MKVEPYFMETETYKSIYTYDKYENERKMPVIGDADLDILSEITIQINNEIHLLYKGPVTFGSIHYSKDTFKSKHNGIYQSTPEIKTIHNTLKASELSKCKESSAHEHHLEMRRDLPNISQILENLPEDEISKNNEVKISISSQPESTNSKQISSSHLFPNNIVQKTLQHDTLVNLTLRRSKEDADKQVTVPPMKVSENLKKPIPALRKIRKGNSNNALCDTRWYSKPSLAKTYANVPKVKQNVIVKNCTAETTEEENYIFLYETNSVKTIFNKTEKSIGRYEALDEASLQDFSQCKMYDTVQEVNPNVIENKYIAKHTVEKTDSNNPIITTLKYNLSNKSNCEKTIFKEPEKHNKPYEASHENNEYKIYSPASEVSSNMIEKTWPVKNTAVKQDVNNPIISSLKSTFSHESHSEEAIFNDLEKNVKSCEASNKNIPQFKASTGKIEKKWTAENTDDKNYFMNPVSSTLKSQFLNVSHYKKIPFPEHQNVVTSCEANHHKEEYLCEEVKLEPIEDVVSINTGNLKTSQKLNKKQLECNLKSNKIFQRSKIKTANVPDSSTIKKEGLKHAQDNNKSRGQRMIDLCTRNKHFKDTIKKVEDSASSTSNNEAVITLNYSLRPESRQTISVVERSNLEGTQSNTQIEISPESENGFKNHESLGPFSDENASGKNVVGINDNVPSKGNKIRTTPKRKHVQNSSLRRSKRNSFSKIYNEITTEDECEYTKPIKTNTQFGKNVTGVVQHNEEIHKQDAVVPTQDEIIANATPNCIEVDDKNLVLEAISAISHVKEECNLTSINILSHATLPIYKIFMSPSNVGQDQQDGFNVKDLKHNRLIQCIVCLTTFKTVGTLTTHVKRVHTKEKTKLCPHCDRAFVATGDLTRHVRLHTGDKPFPCTVKGCGKSFISGTCLQKHQSSHAGLQAREHKCDICNNAFYRTYDLDRHKLTHSMKDPHYIPLTCVVCFKKFSRKDELHVHLKRHAGIRPHECSCGRAYTDRSNLKSHLNRFTDHKAQNKCKMTKTD